MDGLMQDYPLTVQHVLWRLEKLFRSKEVVTRSETGVVRTTYEQLLPRINQAAGALRRLGVGSGDRVATLCWNNARHLELYYAVPCMGAVLHTLNLRLFPQDLEYIIRDAEDQVLFVDRTLVPILDKLAGKLPTVKHLVVIGAEDGPLPPNSLGEMLSYEELLKAESSAYPWPRLEERAAAGICYTSGTTGHPKGVVYSHRSQMLHSMAVMMADGLGIAERETVFPIVPMFHANSWGLPYACGMAGSKIVFPDRWMGDAQTVVDLAESEGATIMGGVPTIWNAVSGYLEQSGRRLPKVHTVVCGGAAIPRALMERMDKLGLRMLHAWGMTETSPIGSTARPRSWTAPEEELDVRLMQGFPTPLVELRITDPETSAPLPWDGVAFGEIQVRGPWIAAGYYRNADPGKLTADGWFRTGDVAKITPEGAVMIVDRTKDVIKSGGEWISSVALENAIMGHPKVLEAAVIGLPHPRWDERPVAFVVPRPGNVLGEDELKTFLQEKFAKWWLPDEVRFVDQIPKTSVGKFDKKVLRAAAAPVAASKREN